MALTPEVRVTQGRVYSLTEGATLRLTQARVYASINFPTEELRTTQARVYASTKSGMDLRVTQARVYAAVRGRMDNPRLRAWTFTLDGHDFYVLRLGDTRTLVYDVSSEQWMDWASWEQDFWRASLGASWVGGTALADEYGSNVIVGDDTFGLLWFLDPEQGFDEHPDAAIDEDLPIEHIAMAQLPMRGRDVVPCNVVYLTADNDGPTFSGASVTLSISDDAGKTFWDADTIAIEVGNPEQEFNWYSLGQIGTPGRLFKITDNGLTRLDDFKMNDDGN